MGFDDLLKKGQAMVSDKDGKIDYAVFGEDAKDAYTEFSKKDGTFTDKAKVAYGEIQENHKPKTSDSKVEKKDEKKDDN